MSFTIRQIRSGEEANFRTIRLRALADSPSAFASTLEETEARPTEYWHDRVRSAVAAQENVLFVATDGDAWIGLVGGFVYEETSIQVPYLVSMWVDPAHRGCGVGQALVEQVIEWARERGMAHLLLEVAATNQPAIALYTRCGFRLTGGMKPHPTYPGLEEVMMKLTLDRG